MKTLDRMEGTFFKNEQWESPGTALKKSQCLQQHWKSQHYIHIVVFHYSGGKKLWPVTQKT